MMPDYIVNLIVSYRINNAETMKQAERHAMRAQLDQEGCDDCEKIDVKGWDARQIEPVDFKHDMRHKGIE